MDFQHTTPFFVRHIQSLPSCTGDCGQGDGKCKHPARCNVEQPADSPMTARDAALVVALLVVAWLAAAGLAHLVARVLA